MNPERILKKGLKHLKLPFNEEHISAFLKYLEELKRWNKAYNLTGLKTDEDIIIKHFLDSLLYLKAIPKSVALIADAGSGAGFPGIPIKILRPEIRLSLIESTRKKASFLRHIVRILALRDTIVYQNRIEDLDENEFGRYDVVVTRAAFRIEEFHKKACPYVKDTGFIVISKGQKIRDELKDSIHVKPFIRTIIKTQLPFLRAIRNIVALNCKGPL